MAKCDLSIELDDPQTPRPGGGRVTGTVHVTADADVACKGLEVTSVWRTHGRGNVASGDAGQATLFSGEWVAGETYAYRFDLPVADWPPTYHGHYLNVDHYVDARARIPWAFDPKASAPFPVRPSGGPEAARKLTRAVEVSGLAGCFVGAILFGVASVVVAAMGAAFFQAPWAFLLVGLIPLFGGLVWAFKVALPRYLLGKVTHELRADRVAPGETVRGTLAMTPRKKVPINAITAQLIGTEKVVSGSGSNRRTHTHVFTDQIVTLRPSADLAAGQPTRLPFELNVPPEAPYSVELDDNELLWAVRLRIDIPRWPDWTRELKLAVVPPAADAQAEPHHLAEPHPLAEIETSGQTRQDSAAGGSAGDDITFAETASLLWRVRDDADQVDQLVAAVNGLSFDLEADIERRLLYAGSDPPFATRGHHAVWARFPDPPLPLVLFIPKRLGNEFDALGGNRWRGRGTVVGWDRRRRRLALRVDDPG